MNIRYVIAFLSVVGLLCAGSTAMAQSGKMADPEEGSGKMNTGEEEPAEEEGSGKMSEVTEEEKDLLQLEEEEPKEEVTTEEMPEVTVEGNVDDDKPIYEKGGVAGAGLVIGGKLGAGFGQVTSELGTSFVGELELGWNLPLPDPVNRDLELFVVLGYAGPSAEETVSGVDPRLPGEWSYELTLQQFNITPGLLWRIQVPANWVRPYIAAGPRIYLTKTQVSGEAGGEAFGDNDETATDIGFYGALGADFFPGGPGSILFELQFSYAAVDNFVLQNTNAGSLNLAIGYRLFL